MEFWRWTKFRNGDPAQSIRLAIFSAIYESIVDLLFYVIGFFTYLYFLSFAYLFFFHQSPNYPLAVKIMHALSEPYLGSVGIYVILKELRKARYNLSGRHKGEVFVFSWTALLIASLILVIFSSNFSFDILVSDIITISLALLVIYVGGIIHKP